MLAVAGAMAALGACSLIYPVDRFGGGGDGGAPVGFACGPDGGSCGYGVCCLTAFSLSNAKCSTVGQCFADYVQCVRSSDCASIQGPGSVCCVVTQTGSSTVHRAECLDAGVACSGVVACGDDLAHGSCPGGGACEQNANITGLYTCPP